MSVTLYVPVVSLQGSDEWNDFERAAYPEREGSSLGFCAKEAATAYLAERMPDEMPDLRDGEILSLGEYPSLHEGGCQTWHETEQYVAVWDAGYCLAGLWLKQETTTRDADTSDDSDDPDTHEFGCTCFLCIPGA